MTKRRFIALILMVFILASCSARKGHVKPGDAAMADQQGSTQAAGDTQEPFSLPDVDSPLDDATDGQVTAAPDLEAILVEDNGQEQFIVLNFDNTDIETILATFGELLGINYILTPGISGNVTIQSYSRVPVNNLFQIFQSILEVNGLAALQDGDFYRIVPIDMVKTLPMDVKKGMKAELSLDESFLTQLLPLENVQASQVSGVLRELMPRGTSLIVYEPSNLLIVTAKPRTMEKFRKIIEALDMDSQDSGSIRTFVYYVENGEAKKLESILKTVYLGKSTAAASKSALPSPARGSRPPSTRSASSLPGDLGDINISAYEDINALIIQSSPRSYLSLLKVLGNIDVPPKQVLIEVLIAEVTLGDKTSYGLEWMLRMNNGNFIGLNPGRFMGATGDLLPPGEVGINDISGQFTAVSSGTMDNDSYVGLFTAIATENDLNVMASPNILAMDNKEAEIKIGNEVPTATSTTQSTEGSTTSAQIQYKTVGTILTVTPHITEKGNVSMKIVVESSDIGASTTIGTGNYPSFITRRATTNALVKDGHTLFLGGLMSDKKSRTKSGIPFLSKIPIIGYLFGGQSWTNEKTEMFVMVTPHVVNDVEEADQLTRRYNDKVKTIRRDIFKIKDSEDEVMVKEQDITEPSTEPVTEPAAEPMPDSAEGPAAKPDADVPAPYVPEASQ